MKSFFLAAILVLSFAPAAFAEEAPRFACGGTEPFWSLYINSKQTTLKNLSVESNVEHKVVAPMTPQSQMPGYNFVYQTQTTENQPATIVVMKRQCTDGMSDTIYPYSVIYASGNTVLSGCCFKNN